MSANFLGREKNNDDVAGFGEGSTSVAKMFSPVDTYGERIDDLFAEIVAFRGFEPFSLISEREGWKLNAKTSWEAATCLDPATFAFTAVRDGKHAGAYPILKPLAADKTSFIQDEAKKALKTFQGK